MIRSISKVRAVRTKEQLLRRIFVPRDALDRRAGISVVIPSITLAMHALGSSRGLRVASTHMTPNRFRGDKKRLGIFKPGFYLRFIAEFSNLFHRSKRKLRYGQF